MPSDLVKSFPFLFYLQITCGTETRKERSLQTRKGRKRERKNDSQTQRRDRAVKFAPSISLFLDLPLPFESGLIAATSHRLWSRLRANRDHRTTPRDLASCRTQAPLSLPFSLNLTGFDDIFFWVLFVFLYWGMNDIIYLFGNRENVSNK